MYSAMLLAAMTTAHGRRPAWGGRTAIGCHGGLYLHGRRQLQRLRLQGRVRGVGLRRLLRRAW